MDVKSKNKEGSRKVDNLAKIFTLAVLALLAFGISTTSQRLNAE